PTLLNQRFFLTAKTFVPLVKDVSTIIYDVAPARPQGSHAKVIFLAISSWKSFGIEQSDVLEGCSSNIHAKPIASRYRRIQSVASASKCDGKLFFCHPLW